MHRRIVRWLNDNWIYIVFFLWLIVFEPKLTCYLPGTVTDDGKKTGTIEMMIGDAGKEGEVGKTE